MNASADRKRPAVFIDRDGTLNREIEGALSRPEQLEIAPAAARALRSLGDAGFRLVVITNQSAIARGELDHERLARVHEALALELERDGATIDLFVACPHHESEGFAPYRRLCPCRKPRPGMLLDAAERLDLDLAKSFVIGDAERDLEAGRAVGARGVLVASGKGTRELERMRAAGRAPDFCANDLADAAAWIVTQGK